VNDAAADKVGKLTVFNLGGNKVRLIAAIHSDISSTLQAWPTLSNLVYVPHTAEEYTRLVAVLDALIDEVGEDERHPLASLMEVMGLLIERYEDEHVPELTRESGA
jgi:HTH-type transcriptional regulator/antitoxin HigA